MAVFPSAAVLESEVRIRLRAVSLNGTLVVPQGASGLVLFAHGSGSSRRSPRNALVAREIQRAGIGTLLFDLLTEAEDCLDMRTHRYRDDIDLLAARLVAATDWAHQRPDTRELPIGYFGASTGSAAALIAAASPGDHAHAVVSRGGRPDLAWEALPAVTAPTLLIVGGLDAEVIELNKRARAKLRCRKSLKIVPGASHFFEEAGTLERVSALARNWFLRHWQAGAANGA